ncbi:MAG TPA: MFS transporter [Dehalococcoidia bacterium]|nr:MFS transporter [Dehalococcoidia bacterium]
MADYPDAQGPHHHAIAVLRHRDYRLLWIGQLISTTGDMMQTVALAWHMFVLTDSTFQVGLLALSGFVPFLGLSFVGGAIADRFDRRRVILVTQSANLLATLALVTATFGGFVSPGILYGIAFAIGGNRAFDAPARQALIPNLVPRAELGAALTLNTMLRQLATTVGPGLGGILMGVAGVGAAYALNAASFAAVIVALLLMNPVVQLRGTSTSRAEMVLGGLRFVRGETIVLSLLVLDFLVVVLGSTQALMPAFARDILAVGPEGLGFLYAAPAIGAIVGALILGAIGTGWRNLSIVLVTYACFGVFILGFGLGTVFGISLLLLFGSGFVDVIGEIMRGTIIQLRTPDEVRGRVTSLSVIFSAGGPQVGQFSSGVIATMAGPAGAAVIGGAAVVFVTGLFALNPMMRRRADPDRHSLDATSSIP